MPLVLRDSKPRVPNHLPQDIIIAGVPVGEVELIIFEHSGELRWHAVFRMSRFPGGGSGLMQGHGTTPETAISDAVVKARIERDEFIRHVDYIEKQLGLSGVPSEEIKKREAAAKPVTSMDRHNMGVADMLLNGMKETQKTRPSENALHESEANETE